MARLSLPGGAPLIAVGAVDSTNAEAQRRLEAGEALAGSWIVADSQSAGRGRLGRVWESAPGNLYASFIAPAPPRLEPLPFAAGLAMRDAALALGAPAAGLLLKWPNDLLLGGAKLGGILVERRADDAAPVVIGFGLNLAHAPAGVDATHLGALGIVATPAAALAALATAFAARLAQTDYAHFPALTGEWLAFAAHRPGDPIRVAAHNTVFEGTFAGLDGWGGLMIALHGGGAIHIPAGDVLLGDATTRIAS